MAKFKVGDMILPIGKKLPTGWQDIKDIKIIKVTSSMYHISCYSVDNRFFDDTTYYKNFLEKNFVVMTPAAKVLFSKKGD